MQGCKREPQVGPGLQNGENALSNKTGMAGELQTCAGWRTQDARCPGGRCDDRFCALRLPITRRLSAREPSFCTGAKYSWILVTHLRDGWGHVHWGPAKAWRDRPRPCGTPVDEPLFAVCISPLACLDTRIPPKNGHLAYADSPKNGHLAEGAALPTR
jgi:hypothetical protein